MKITGWLLFGIFNLLIPGHWRHDPEGPLSKAAWLIGTWEHKTARGSIYETWSVLSDTGFSGKSYTLRENDTLVFETIHLLRKGDSLFYIPSVKAQNEGRPVCFTAVQVSDDRLVFSNPAHDFPQTITYSRTGTDSLLAVISGLRNGRLRQQDFPMKRLKHTP